MRRSRDPEPGSRVTAQAGRDATPDATSDAALDAVAAILRALRDAAARDPGAASRLEAWARHILVLAPPPGSDDAAPRSRDWGGLGSHVVSHVREDHAAVSRSIGDLQDTVWLVVERLSQAIVGAGACLEAECLLADGVVVGDGARVGARNRLRGPVKVATGASLPPDVLSD